jgi:23S rRNA C2498 (ribose-2'-O)-methylase RlmM
VKRATKKSETYLEWFVSNINTFKDVKSTEVLIRMDDTEYSCQLVSYRKKFSPLYDEYCLDLIYKNSCTMSASESSKERCFEIMTKQMNGCYDGYTLTKEVA